MWRTGSLKFRQKDIDKYQRSFYKDPKDSILTPQPSTARGHDEDLVGSSRLLTCHFWLSSWYFIHRSTKRSLVVTDLQMAKHPDNNGGNHQNVDRRNVLTLLSTTAALWTTTFFSQPALAQEKGKIVVFGGSGYVGSHVDQLLAKDGYQVVSVSRSSPSDQATKVQNILGTVPPNVEFMSLDANKDDLSSVLQGANAVVSCVGALPGSPNQRDGNGAVNRKIANASKAAGIQRFVYISVASDLANGPAKFLLGDYFKGKAEAESAVVAGLFVR